MRKNDIIIIKILNNNCVLVKHNCYEKVVFGKGIGFAKKKGDKIDKSLIERVFIEQSY